MYTPWTHICILILEVPVRAEEAKIGSGNSTHLPEKIGDISFWTEQLFHDELNNLLAHLGSQDNYDILGHSPQAPNPGKHAGHWMDAQNDLRAHLPQGIQDVLDKYEKEGTTPRGRWAVLSTSSNAGHRLTDSHGTSTFKATGSLENRTMVYDAQNIAVPTLLLNGRYDQAQDSVLDTFFVQSGASKREGYMEVVENFLVDGDESDAI
ncbi:hypothetical protein B0H17DRAFT_1129931 [Mycena rosella]|uniref:Uncharacterized protein n=1 Tax=Mycena rosella TaxID=1033263 RepID=A0AAD7DS32_MYCRO|nr:hypothetical protein B0H17DRAFT_1129931 [Mycena rosella]